YLLASICLDGWNPAKIPETPDRIKRVKKGSISNTDKFLMDYLTGGYECNYVSKYDVVLTNTNKYYINPQNFYKVYKHYMEDSGMKNFMRMKHNLEEELIKSKYINEVKSKKRFTICNIEKPKMLTVHELHVDQLEKKFQGFKNDFEPW